MVATLRFLVLNTGTRALMDCSHDEFYGAVTRLAYLLESRLNISNPIPIPQPLGRYVLFPKDLVALHAST